MEDADLFTTAELAYIELSPAEVDRLKTEVGNMVLFFQKMNELSVESLEPTTHALARGNRTRTDACIDQPGSNLSDAILEQAPDLEDRFICIPNVL